MKQIFSRLSVKEKLDNLNKTVLNFSRITDLLSPIFHVFPSIVNRFLFMSECNIEMDIVGSLKACKYFKTYFLDGNFLCVVYKE